MPKFQSYRLNHILPTWIIPKIGDSRRLKIGLGRDPIKRNTCIQPEEVTAYCVICVWYRLEAPHS